MSIADRLAELAIELPVLPPPVANYVPAVRTGNLVYASGQTPTIDGKLTITGKLGDGVSLEQGMAAARLAIVNCLAEVATVADIDDVVRIVKLTGYVASATGFTDQPKVINGASVVLEEIFGDAGRHARAALGLAELPGGAPVEVDLIVELRG